MTPVDSGPRALLRVLDHYLSGKKWVDGRDFYVLDYLSTLAERYPNSATSLGAIGDYTKKVRNPLCPPDIGMPAGSRSNMDSASGSSL